MVILGGQSMPTVRLMLGDCLDRMGEIEDQSIDCIVTDPPYPCIDRPYGRMTEAEWHAMMRGVVAHCRRVLKPEGSAVFILQANYERPGRMRPWLWEFLAWAAREWGVVQDAYWWNLTAQPAQGCRRDVGLLRSSVKACAWLGPEGCYRDQDAVLWRESERNRACRATYRVDRGRDDRRPSGKHNNRHTWSAAAGERDGVTPFNLLPFPVVKGPDSAGAHGHGAGTPMALCDWWVRYLSPPDGVACDPFMGSGTTGLAALKRGRSFVGVEKMPAYFATAGRRIAAVQAAMPLFPATA
jgi:DNA modification methylase